MLEEKVVRYIH